MTFAERNSIANPAAGLMIYCTDCGVNVGEPQYFNGTIWVNMLGGTALNFVTIGTQVWHTKNLDVVTYRNGDTIPHVTDVNQLLTLTTGAWFWYNNDSATYAATYGRLYNWYAVNDPRGLTPVGWHVPSHTEWTILINQLEGPTIAGGALKSTSYWNSPNTGATNSSGFSALPGGSFFNFLPNIGEEGSFWSSTENGPPYAWILTLYSYSASAVLSYSDKVVGYSVRCLRD